MSSTTEMYAPRPDGRFANKVLLYKPLLGGLLAVVAGTYLVGLLRSTNGMLATHQLMNVFMGVFFLVFATPKLFNLAAFADAFRQYDIISSRSYAYARAYPFIELSLGIVLVSGVAEVSVVASYVINSIIAIITGTTLVGVVRSLKRKEQLDCACMGAALRFPLSKVAVVENGLMLLMALSMLFINGSAHMAMISLTQFQVIR